MNKKGWTKMASDLLLGKRIVKVEYMQGANIKEMGWYSCPIMLQLEDGNWIIPQSDDEGNNGGVIAVASKEDYVVLPVLGLNHE